MRAIVSASALAILLGAASPARSDQSLAPALSGDVAATLPRGRFMISYSRFGMDVTRRYDASGEARPISELFQRDVAWREAIEDDPSRSAQLEGLLASKGVSPSDSAGEYLGEFRGDVLGHVPVVGYGITDRVGVFAAIPVLSVRVRSSVAYRPSPSARSLVRKLREEGNEGSARDFADSLEQGFPDQLRKAGYDYSESRDRSAVGDLRLESPWVLRDSRGTRAAAIATLIAPTGEPADPREFYGISTGQGRWQAGARAVGSRDLGAFRVTGAAGFLVPMPGRRAVRVPRWSGDRLSPLIDESARVTGGESWSLALDGRYELGSMWIARSGVQHQRRLRDRFAGSLASAERYRLVGDPTSERLESVFLNVEWNTIRPFLAGKFPFPVDIVAGVAAPISGKNAIADRIAYLQSNLFF